MERGPATDTERVTIRFSEDDVGALRQEATATHATVSEVVRLAVRAHLGRQAALGPGPQAPGDAAPASRDGRPRGGGDPVPTWVADKDRGANRQVGPHDAGRGATVAHRGPPPPGRSPQWAPQEPSGIATYRTRGASCVAGGASAAASTTKRDTSTRPASNAARASRSRTAACRVTLLVGWCHDPYRQPKTQRRTAASSVRANAPWIIVRMPSGSTHRTGSGVESAGSHRWLSGVGQPKRASPPSLHRAAMA